MDTKLQSHLLDHTTLDEVLLNKKGGLLIAQWNVNGFSQNIRMKLHYVITTKSPDIVLLQEGHIQYQTKDFTINIDNYITYTQNNGYGKVITLIRRSIYIINYLLNFHQIRR